MNTAAARRLRPVLGRRGNRIRGGRVEPGLFAAGYGVRCVARQPTAGRTGF